MELLIRSLGAFVVTYVASRVLLRLFGKRATSWVLPLFGVHLLCLAILAISVAWIRAYWGTFAWEAAIPYIAPQIFWFVVDTLRLRR